MKFNPENEVSTQKVFTETLIKLGSKYKNFVVLDANVSAPLQIAGFDRAYPDRHFKFGNAVRAMMGAAAGLTVRGKIPIVCAYALSVSGRVWDEVRNFAAYSNLNIKIVGINAGLLNAEEGVINQSLEDLAIMRSIPNTKVICPADAVEAKKALEFMMLDYGPCYLRLFNLPLPELYSDHHQFVLGKGHIYKYGSDVCIFAVGTGVHTALDAARILERKGVSAMVVHMSSLNPLDGDLVIECAKSVRYVVTVEDHQITGGLGSAISEVLTENHPCKVLRIGMEGFAESGKVDDLYRKYGLDGVSIAEKIEEYIKSDL